MKRIWLIVACLVVAGFLVLALIPGNTKNGIVANDAYRFYYYPKLNAYYDFQEGNFVYTVDGGENWLKKKPKNAKLPEKLSQKVMLSGPVPDIWRYNEDHRKAHNGVNTNYLSKEGPNKPVLRSGNEIVGGADYENVDAETNTSAKINTEQPVANVREVKRTESSVQQLPEEEWEADMQVEVERLFNEGRKNLKEVLEVDSL